MSPTHACHQHAHVTNTRMSPTHATHRQMEHEFATACSHPNTNSQVRKQATTYGGFGLGAACERTVPRAPLFHGRIVPAVFVRHVSLCAFNHMRRANALSITMISVFNSPHVGLHVIKTHFIVSLLLDHGSCGMLHNLAQNKFGLLKKKWWWCTQFLNNKELEHPNLHRH